MYVYFWDTLIPINKRKKPIPQHTAQFNSFQLCQLFLFGFAILQIITKTSLQDLAIGITVFQFALSLHSWVHSIVNSTVII